MPRPPTQTQTALQTLVAEMRSNPLSQALFADASRFVLVVDLDGTVVDVNEFAAPGRQLPRDAFVGRAWWSTPAFQHDEAAWEARWRERFFEVLGGDAPRSYDDVFEAEGYETFAVLATVTALREPGGEPVGFLLTAQNVEVSRQSEERVKEQERLRRLTFDQSYQLTAMLDPAGTILDINAAIERIGWDRDAIIGQNVVDFAGAQPDGDQLRLEWAQRLIDIQTATRPIQYTEVRPETVDEAARAIDGTLTPVRDETGELEFLLLEIRDRTDSYRAEQQLRTSEERFRHLAEALPQMVWVAGTDGNAQFFSNRWAEFTGRPVEDLLGRGFMDLVHPADRPTLTGRPLDTAIDQGSVQFRLLRHDGEYRWMEAQMSTTVDEHGNRTGVFGGTLDITERREAEDRAREREEYLRATLQLTGFGTYTWYVQEDRFSQDSQLGEILGVPMDQMVIGNAFDLYFALVHPDDRERSKQAVLGALVPGGPDYASEFRMVVPGPDGPEVKWVSAMGRAEFDPLGEPIRLVGVFADITARRHEDDARLRLQKLEAMGTLASGIAHDFNNVIGAILSYARVAEAELAAGESPAASIGEIARGALRAGDIVKRLLTFSREEEPRRSAFDLGEIVDEACALVRPTLGPQIVLESSVAHALPNVHGDASQLHQVVVNLLTNAGQAIGQAPGRIDVVLDQVALGERRNGMTAPLLPGDYLRLRVTDDGPGIPDHIVGRIFDPFFTTKGPHEGTGLGLAAVQSIIRNHGGVVAAESGPGAGTTFTAYLPVDVAPGAAEPESAPLLRTSGGEEAGARVLFVDDEEALVRLAHRAMPFHKCSVVGFTDPFEAAEAFEADPAAFDALVTDLSMPGLTGLELADRVRAIRPDLAIVLTSGYMAPEDHAAARRRGVDAVLPKPCSIDDLAAEVKRLLAR